MKLKGENIGSPISEDLSDYLKKFTSGVERAQASARSEVSPHTIHSLIIRRIPLTEDNSRGIEALVEIAIERCKTTIQEAKSTCKKLERLAS